MVTARHSFSVLVWAMPALCSRCPAGQWAAAWGHACSCPIHLVLQRVPKMWGGGFYIWP